MTRLKIGNCIIEQNLNPTACRQVVKNESKEEDVIDEAILDEIKRLNAIKEERPVNRNSILESRIAKATRKLLQKQK